MDQNNSSRASPQQAENSSNSPPHPELAPWKFREAVDNAGHAILFTALDSTIEYVNPAFEEMTGYDASEAMGQTPQILKSDEHDEAFYSDMWNTITGGNVWHGELVNEDADGERFVVEQTIAPIPREGETRGYVAINTDITEKRERERKLQSLHDATRRLMDVETFESLAAEIGYATEEILGFPINVVRFREGNRLVPTYINDEAQSLLAETDRPTYEVGEGPAGRAYQQGAPQLYNDVSALDDEYCREPVSSWLYVPLGEYGVISVGQTESDALDQHDVQLVQTLANNAEAVCERLDRERELERENERLERFASTISHDLRNPLQVAELTLEEVRDVTERLDRMTTAHKRMEEIIEGVLALARRGERVEETEQITIPDLACQCWEYVSTSGTELVMEEPADGEFVMEADADRLKHVFENLFRNAITHGNAATIRVGPTENGGFYVADDGTGIPPEKREQVFETGFTTEQQGTGLGLSIVREIAEAHGWKPTLTESEEGGARFEFTPAYTDQFDKERSTPSLT